MTLPTNIVVGTDFSEQAEKAVQYAIDLARRIDAHVHLVHSWMIPVAATSEVAIYTEEMVARLETDAEKVMEELLIRHRAEFTNIDGAVVCGDARDVILKVAADQKAELLVVGTHGRRGFRRMLLGSVAESIVRSATCSVLIVR